MTITQVMTEDDVEIIDRGIFDFGRRCQININVPHLQLFAAGGLTPELIAKLKDVMLKHLKIGEEELIRCSST